MIKSDEIDILEETDFDSFVVLPYSLVQKLVKIKSDEKFIEYISKNNGTLFHFGTNEPVHVIKKYLVEFDEDKRCLHEVVEFRPESAKKGSRYLLSNEMTFEEFCKHKKRNDVSPMDMPSLWQEWQESIG